MPCPQCVNGKVIVTWTRCCSVAVLSVFRLSKHVNQQVSVCSYHQLLVSWKLCKLISYSVHHTEVNTLWSATLVFCPVQYLYLLATCSKFCLKLGRTVTEIYQILKIILKKQTVSRIHTFDWPSKGRSEGTSFNDAEHSKHSSTCKMYENLSWIKELVYEHRPVSAQFGVSMAFVMKIAASLDVMLYWVVISCVWGEPPASIFRVVKEKGLPWRWR
jgi:hypothetical protein